MRVPNPFRLWFYLRTGYSVYFTFIFASVNVMTVTYYLAIENLPILKQVFPDFASYVLTQIIIGIPVLIFIGWLHFRRSTAFKSEAEIALENNPYYFKLAPGHTSKVVMPFYLMTTRMLVKISRNEPISDEELKKIKGLEEQMEHLLKGGYVGEYRQKD